MCMKTIPIDIEKWKTEKFGMLKIFKERYFKVGIPYFFWEISNKWKLIGKNRAFLTILNFLVD